MYNMTTAQKELHCLYWYHLNVLPKYRNICEVGEEFCLVLLEFPVHSLFGKKYVCWKKRFETRPEQDLHFYNLSIWKPMLEQRFDWQKIFSSLSLYLSIAK